VLKDLKESTKQRFSAIVFSYPETAEEVEIVAREARIDAKTAKLLVQIGRRTRNLMGHGLDEGASTRMLIQAGRLMAGGIELRRACAMAIVLPITDDHDLQDALSEIVAACG
jgi:nitric oxide reductase NorQ protein